MSELVRWEPLKREVAKARQALSEVASVEEAVKTASYAEAVRYAAKQAGASLTLQNSAAEIRLRAERRSGQLQREAQERGELAKKSDPAFGGDRLASDEPTAPPPTLRDLASESESSVSELKRHRAVADVPDEVFENYINEMQDEGKEITTKGLVSLVDNRVVKNAGGVHEGTDLSEGDSEGDGWKLLLGDSAKRLQELPDESVNLIVTDPPYGKEHLSLWDLLGEQAHRLLVPGGVLFARSGHLFLPDVLSRVAQSGLAFGWLYSEPLPGSNVRFQGRKIAVSWQPWIAFSKGSWPSGAIDWHPDQLTESPRTKSRYVWEQKWDVGAEIIATFAQPGHDVLDPFAGTGTYGVAALSVGCRWIGIEKDAAGHAAATIRLLEHG